MINRRILLLTALAAVLLTASCSAPAAPTLVPAAPTALPVTAVPVATAPSAATAAPTAAAAAATTKPTVQPTAAAKPTALPTAGAQTKPGTPGKLNMAEIFPPGPGRETTLDNCITCHTIVPLVVLQYGQQQWDLSALNHRDRLPRLSDADYKSIFDYLAKNFNPDHPVPALPKELLDTWTDY